MFRLIGLFLVVVALTACVSTRARHGYIIERGETELTAEVGIDSKESIIARYGEPTLRPALNDNTWYYIASRSNARAFYETQTTSREIVAFSFDQDGSVVSVDKLDLDDGQSISLVGRETPTRGKELTFLEQLMGSVGSLPLPEERVPGQQ